MSSSDYKERRHALHVADRLITLLTHQDDIEDIISANDAKQDEQNRTEVEKKLTALLAGATEEDEGEDTDESEGN